MIRLKTEAQGKSGMPYIDWPAAEFHQLFS